MYTFHNTINDILEVIRREEPILRSLSEDVITTRFNHQHRSIKMLIGHLIDSASNNHVDETKFNNYWLDYEGNRVTLNDMIIGYTSHLNLHLGQIHELTEQ